MANFLLTYHGEGGMAETEEARAQTLETWSAWFGGLGDAVVDGGNPTRESRAISSDGSVMAATSAPTGYSILKADTIEAAVALAKGCPVLAGGGIVVVSETINAM